MKKAFYITLGIVALTMIFMCRFKNDIKHDFVSQNISFKITDKIQTSAGYKVRPQFMLICKCTDTKQPELLNKNFEFNTTATTFSTHNVGDNIVFKTGYDGLRPTYSGVRKINVVQIITWLALNIILLLYGIICVVTTIDPDNELSNTTRIYSFLGFMLTAVFVLFQYLIIH